MMAGDIGEQLRAAVVDATTTRSLYSIAKQAGVDPSVVSRWVRGERDLQLATAAKISAVVGLELRAVDRQ
jgi:transcriptional regulator with XRE-family HTH domain